MKIKYFTFVFFSIANSSSLLSDDEDFLEASGDDFFDQDEEVFSTETTVTILSTFSIESESSIDEANSEKPFYEDFVEISTEKINNDSTIYDEELVTVISEFFPNSEKANEEIENLQEEITELIEKTINEQKLDPIEKMKKQIMDERDQEKWDMLKWITFSSIIAGFLLICAFFALLIRRYQQKDRGSYEIMTPFEYQKGNREAFA
ncbi:unnamed protein product [Oikopleura dioica]|uniref:Uncharacterized protein n=1 Tax=Oikopleura dioica TaxID=34765 RepID=E4X6C0_OIKDI|nr:unnamed protein product [Oikopleura dioica]